ncbi:unnamed protein product [Rotaria sp. Silwood1]|nr:unnamed protein product [Rotaria sp. Silwood1]
MASSVVYRRKCAIIIGINKYRRDPLQYCINDAEDLSTILRSINFDITLELNCDLNHFYRIMDRFADTVQYDDLVLFYFASHGKQSEMKIIYYYQIMIIIFEVMNVTPLRNMPLMYSIS